MNSTVCSSRCALFVLLAVYLAGLGWGHVRLPWAALLSRRDHQLIRETKTYQRLLHGQFEDAGLVELDKLLHEHRIGAW